VRLRTRLALLSTAATAVVVVGASTAAYVATRADLRRAFDEQLTARAMHLGPAGRFDPDHLGDRPPRPGEGGIRTTDVSVQYIVGSTVVRLPGQTQYPAAVPSDLAVARGEVPATLRDAEVDGVHTRVLTVATPRPSVAVMIAQPWTATDAALDRLRLVLAAIAAGGILLAGLLGLVVARTGLAPVDAVADAAERVARTEDLSERLPVSGDDEVARLATSLNSMLEALEGSRRQQRHLIEDAGHELKTPLTSVRTNVELLSRVEASGTPLPAPERASLLTDLRGQVEELSVLVGELVDLARERPPASEAVEVDLTAVVERAAARTRVHGAAPTIALDLEPATVDGNQRLLERAVTNLLSNAVAWSPPDGTVEVRLRGTAITVRDHGPGFEPGDLGRVFDRFYRSDAARGKPGSGLGLAIVRQIAEWHGGTVDAANAPGGGGLVTLRLGSPAAVPASPDP
jgi:two-component system sensor histidine kinase MprB